MIICKRTDPPEMIICNNNNDNDDDNDNDNNNDNDNRKGGDWGDGGEGTEGGEEGKGGGGGEEILAHGTDRQTGQPKVVQEVLADLKIAI